MTSQVVQSAPGAQSVQARQGFANRECGQSEGGGEEGQTSRSEKHKQAGSRGAQQGEVQGSRGVAGQHKLCHVATAAAGSRVLWPRHYLDAHAAAGAHQRLDHRLSRHQRRVLRAGWGGLGMGRKLALLD